MEGSLFFWNGKDSFYGVSAESIKQMAKGPEMAGF
jgi:hypothetical protein